MSKPSIPQGTRDFSAGVMSKRKHILSVIETVYRSFGFMPLETPAMENIDTLTGKYGSEGDQLLFRILNSGDFMKDVPPGETDLKKMSAKIASKGLRYDLTVPLARYVSMNRHEISLPYKRYQIQPVWRADRPQKGRYREFWQCDADVLGTPSLLCEADFIRIYRQVFKRLGIAEYELRINHRKLLEAVAEKAGATDMFRTLTVIIDKTDKIGPDGVARELSSAGLNSDQIQTVQSFLVKRPLNRDTLEQLTSSLGESEAAASALNDLQELLRLAPEGTDGVVLDGSLARGLDYYTGCIFEAVPLQVSIGSISGGGRYDDLTSVFGLKEKVSGIGISFGIDRIYDVMEELKLFGNELQSFTDVLFCPMDDSALMYCLPLADELREAGKRAEIYPAPGKLRKQLDYANAKHIPMAVIAGENEMKENKVMVKDLHSGNQNLIDKQELVNFISSSKLP